MELLVITFSDVNNMALKLQKKISRECIRLQARGRSLVVSLNPGDTISLRPKGTRQEIELSLGHVWNLCQIIKQKTIYDEKMKLYKEGKNGGKTVFKRLRKPKPPGQYFNRFYYKAL